MADRGSDLRQAIQLALGVSGQGDVRDAHDLLVRLKAVLDSFSGPAGEAADATARLDAAMASQGRAAEAAGKATADAATRASTATRAGVDQQVADMARLQDALGAMEARDHDRRADDARAEQLRDEIALQEHLGRMEREATQAAVQGAQATAAARQRGEQEILDQVVALDRVAAATARAQQAATREANARTWMNKQSADLDQLIQEMHEYERVAQTVQVEAGVAGVNAGRAFGAGVDKGFDAARAGAKARLGLGVANMLQDTIQGGSPAFAINNVLGMAGDTGIKSLIGDTIAAAGGLGKVAAGFGTVATAAGAAFLVIDGGLKNAKLGWGDLDDVVGNLAPIHAAAEAFEGLGKVAADAYKTFSETTVGAGTIAFVTSLGTSITTAARFVDEYTIGWGKATEATKAHKTELERGSQAARDYVEATKDLAKFQSAAQDKRAETGKLVGQELAELGGAGGIEGLAAKLTEQATARGGEDKVKRQEIDARGKVTEVEVTRREAMRRSIMTQFGRAVELGDPNAVGDIAQRLRGAGMDPAGFLDASRGVDKDKAAKEQEEVDKATRESANALEAEFDRRVKDDVRRVREAFQDQLVDAIHTAVKEGGEGAASGASRAQRDALARGIAGRDVPAARVEAVADAILEQATDAALNAARSGQPPRLARDREQRRKQDVAQAVRSFNPAFDDDLESALLGRMANRQGPDAAVADLLPQVQRRLRGSGVAEDAVDDAAREIMQKAMDKVRAELAGIGPESPQAAAQALGARQDKRAAGAMAGQARAKRLDQGEMAQQFAGQFQQAGGFEPVRANQMGKQAAKLVGEGADPAQAMQEVMRKQGVQGERAQRVMVKMAANAEAAAGMIGEATRMLAVLDQRANALGQHLKMLQQNQARVRNLNPGLGGRR